MDHRSPNADLLKQFYNAIPLQDNSDFTKEADRRKYIPDLHTSAGRDPVAELAQNIDFMDSAASYLFTGHRGTGKTVELKQLAILLEQEYNCTVFMVDMADYLLESSPIGVADLLTAVMGALSEAYAGRYGANPLRETYWTRFANFMRSEVEIKEFGGKFESVDIKLALKTNPTFKQELQSAMARALEKFVKDARAFADEIVAAVRIAETDPSRKVVMIVDSLERIYGSGDRAEAVYNSIRDTFHGNAQSLRFNTLHVVYSVPPVIPLIAHGIGTLYSGGLCGLPQVKVFETPTGSSPDRTPDAAGLDKLFKVITSRFSRWDAVFSEQQIKRMALKSGGNLRIFFSLIQRVLVKAARLPIPLADDSLIEYAENDIRAEMPLTGADREWLIRVALSHGMALQNVNDLSTLARLFDHHLILDYRNGEPWYDVLPLVREKLTRGEPPV